MSESLDLEHTFNHPFREVISAWIRKDSHPSQENVSSHILERYVDESGKLITFRILETNLLHCASTYMFENTEIDLTNQTVISKSKNLNYRNVIEYEDYISLKGNGSQTVYFTSSKATYPWFLSVFKTAVEKMGRDLFEKSTSAIQEIIDSRSQEKQENSSGDIHSLETISDKETESEGEGKTGKCNAINSTQFSQNTVSTSGTPTWTDKSCQCDSSSTWEKSLPPWRPWFYYAAVLAAGVFIGMKFNNLMKF